MHQHAVIIEDPTHKRFTGTVIAANQFPQAAGEGVVILPIEPELLRLGGISGYVKREYGEGFVFDGPAASRGCPLVMSVAPDLRTLHWCARLVPEVRRVQAGQEPIEPAMPSGMLRFSSDTAQTGGGMIGLFSEDGPTPLHGLGEPDAAGGWIVHGKANINVVAATVAAFMLYGMSSGVRVRYLAVSQTR